MYVFTLFRALVRICRCGQRPEVREKNSYKYQKCSGIYQQKSFCFTYISKNCTNRPNFGYFFLCVFIRFLENKPLTGKKRPL